MAMTVQQIHPVAHLPLVLGVLRRLAVATVGDGLMPLHPAHVLSCGRGVEVLVLAILDGDHALYKPMVLVSDKPSNGIGFLLTKLRHREGYEARGVGLEAMPLDQQIECGHGECEPGLDIRPGPAHDLFEVALRHEVARLIVWHVMTRMESKDGVRARGGPQGVWRWGASAHRPRRIRR